MIGGDGRLTAELISVLVLLAVTFLPAKRAVAWLPWVGAVLTVGAMAAVAVWHPRNDVRGSWWMHLFSLPVIIWSAIGLGALIYQKSDRTRLPLILGILFGALVGGLAAIPLIIVAAVTFFCC